MLNEDYREMLQALSDENVKYLLVGAYALAAHGYLRATVDMDLWVRPEADNADAVLRALTRFGAPLHNLTRNDLEREDIVFQIGIPPRRIDIITGASGLKFDDAYRNSIAVDMDGLEIRILSVTDLIQNKRAAGRMKDLADAEALEALDSTASPIDQNGPNPTSTAR